MVPDFTDAEGKQISTDLRNMLDPVHQSSVVQSGRQFLNLPIPLDHDLDGNKLGLKVNTPGNKNASLFNRIGIRLRNTPPGKLLFLYEMSSEGKPDSR
jgi:hypothetical protein